MEALPLQPPLAVELVGIQCNLPFLTGTLECWHRDDRHQRRKHHLRTSMYHRPRVPPYHLSCAGARVCLQRPDTECIGSCYESCALSQKVESSLTPWSTTGFITLTATISLWLPSAPGCCRCISSTVDAKYQSDQSNGLL